MYNNQQKRDFRDVEHIEKLNSILEDMDVAVVSYNDLVAKF